MARFAASELRQLLIQAGLQILYRDGLSATASHVPMTAAVAQLEKTHGLSPAMGSIFGSNRLWPNVKEYQLDLLQAALDDHAATGPTDESLTLIDALPDSRTAPFQERQQTLIELCRIAGQINGHIPKDPKRRTWTLWVAIWTTAVSDNTAGERLLPSLAREEQTMIDKFSALYQIMLERLGLRIRSPYTIEQLSTLAAALTNGMALRHGLNDGQRAAEVVSRLNNSQWNLLGIGFAAIAIELIENDGDQPGPP